MLREAYKQGMLAALVKESGLAHQVMVNPAAIGAALGAGGSAISDLVGGNSPDVQKALGMGAGGALVGMGVRHGSSALTRLAKKFPSVGKHMLTSSGGLSPGYADLGWMAPSLLALPAITTASRKDGTLPGRSSQVFRKR